LKRKIRTEQEIMLENLETEKRVCVGGLNWLIIVPVVVNTPTSFGVT
jgi:hypothetical protein